MEIYFYIFLYGIILGQIFFGFWGKIINCYIVCYKLVKYINIQEKKDLLIYILNGNSIGMFFEYFIYYVFCNIYLYFFYLKFDEIIIRMIFKC